jgi:hypothetical protein
MIQPAHGLAAYLVAVLVLSILGSVFGIRRERLRRAGGVPFLSPPSVEAVAESLALSPHTIRWSDDLARGSAQSRPRRARDPRGVARRGHPPPRRGDLDAFFARVVDLPRG